MQGKILQRTSSPTSSRFVESASTSASVEMFISSQSQAQERKEGCVSGQQHYLLLV